MRTGSVENPFLHAKVQQRGNLQLVFIPWLFVRLCPVLPLVWRLLGHPTSPSEPALVFCRNPLLCGVAEGLCQPKTSAKLLLSAGRFWSQWGHSQSLAMDCSLLGHYSFELDNNYFSHFNFFHCQSNERASSLSFLGCLFWEDSWRFFSLAKCPWKL